MPFGRDLNRRGRERKRQDARDARRRVPSGERVSSGNPAGSWRPWRFRLTYTSVGAQVKGRMARGRAGQSATGGTPSLAGCRGGCSRGTPVSFVARRVPREGIAIPPWMIAIGSLPRRVPREGIAIPSWMIAIGSLPMRVPREGMAIPSWMIAIGSLPRRVPREGIAIPSWTIAILLASSARPPEGFAIPSRGTQCHTIEARSALQPGGLNPEPGASAS